MECTDLAQQIGEAMAEVIRQEIWLCGLCAVVGYLCGSLNYWLDRWMEKRAMAVNCSESGFTLVELVVVIVILGILSVTALPKFIDFRTDAEQSVTDSIAGALGSASTMNYGQWIASDHVRGVSVTGAAFSSTCGVLATRLENPLPDGYSLTLASACVSGTALCRVIGPSGVSSVSSITCTD